MTRGTIAALGGVVLCIVALAVSVNKHMSQSRALREFQQRTAQIEQQLILERQAIATSTSSLKTLQQRLDESQAERKKLQVTVTTLPPIQAELAQTQEEKQSYDEPHAESANHIEIITPKDTPSQHDEEVASLMVALEGVRTELEEKSRTLSTLQQEKGGGEVEGQIREIKAKFVEATEELQKKSILLIQMKEEKDGLQKRAMKLEQGLGESRDREEQALQKLEYERNRLETQIARLNERINLVTARIIKAVG